MTFATDAGTPIAIADVLALLGIVSLGTPISPNKTVFKIEVDKAGGAFAPAKNIPLKKLLSINEVLAVTGVGRTTLYAKLKEGEIKAIKIGRRTFILAEELTEFIESSGVIPSSVQAMTINMGIHGSPRS